MAPSAINPIFWRFETAPVEASPATSDFAIVQKGSGEVCRVALSNLGVGGGGDGFDPIADTPVSSLDAAADKVSFVDASANGGAGGQDTILVGDFVQSGLVDAAAGSGAGRTRRIKSQDAGSGNTDGGALVLEPGAKSGSGADGAVIVRQPGGTPGTDECRIWQDGNYCWLANMRGFQGGSNSFVFWTGATANPDQNSSVIIASDATVKAHNYLANIDSGNGVSCTAIMARDFGFGLRDTGVIGWTAATFAASNQTHDVALVRAAAGVIKVTDGSTGGGWLQIAAGRARVASDATNATATLANLSGLTINVAAGRKYVGRLLLKVNNSQAAEGIKLDFNGGTATMTSFWAVASSPAGGTTVAGTVLAAALSDAINYSTITGETIIAVDFSFVVNAGGTFIPRVAENSHTSGTLTVKTGSFINLEDVP